ncbi:MAG: response regulator [Chlorobiaceae bacterium]
MEKKEPIREEINPERLESFEGLTILIVEDHLISSYLMSKYFKGENLNFLYAGNGLDAVNLVKQFSEINLVLMDIKMPVMNGLEATRQIKALRPDLPVIAQTAYTLPEDRNKAKEAGCDSFITKPINKNELLELIKQLVQR